MGGGGVFVVATPPHALLVAPLGRTVEPLIGAPESVQSTRMGGIGVVDDAVLDRESAHARPIARKGSPIGSARRREPGDSIGNLRRGERMVAAPIIVFNPSRALLFLGDRDIEIEVEVVAGRR